MRNILVIGGRGFIGSHLVERLCRDGYKVSALVRKDQDANFLKSLGVELRFGDLLDADYLKGALSGIDAVFCAVNVKSAGSCPRKYENEVTCLHLDGTKNLINACKANGVRRLIYFSSVAAMGYKKWIDSYDESFKGDPIDAYGKAKLCAEHILNDSFKNGEIDVTIMRPVGIFGERGLGPLAKIIFFINKGFVPILGSGNNLQSISYVGNTVNQAIFLEKSQAAIGKTYICSDQRPYSVNEMIETTGKVMNRRFLKIHIPLWLIKCAVYFFNPALRENILAITTQRIFSGQAIFRELGYKQEFDFAASVARTIKWLKEKKNE